MPRCQAITDYTSRYRVGYHQQCQQSAAHLVDGVGLCGTHFNAGFRKPLTVVSKLRLLDDADMTGSTNGPAPQPQNLARR